MDIIRLLPDSVANQIAAGEVIQRPASCLKELVENSLDAGADHIQIVVRDAGRTLLQVIDNGQGMSDTDLRMAFERHATSKIRLAEDLFQLRTMGFRGEALASICAVAQVEVISRRQEDELGSRILIEGSKVIEQEPVSCAVGTNFKVKNLFFNIPVRRKFLKTDQTELRNLQIEFQHIVLVYPQVHFTFTHNDEVLYDLPVCSEKQRIEAVFGKGTGHPYTSHLVEVATDTDLIAIRGFVGKPEFAGKQSQQYFFVNGRYMRHPYFHKAVLNAYAGMLAGELVPSYFIYLDISPERIDVNIHPTKTEIKFQDEQDIFKIIVASVREALGKFNLTPSIDFDRKGEEEMPIGMGEVARLPERMFDPNYNPFRTKNTRTTDRGEQHQQELPSQWGDLYQSYHPIEQALEVPTDVIPYQYMDKYIITPSEHGLMVINQHRAHVHILYNEWKDKMSTEGFSQQVLFPEVLEVPIEDAALFENLLPDLQCLGFDFTQMAPHLYQVTGVPALLGSNNPLPVLQQVFQEARDSGKLVQNQWSERIVLMLAKEAAIPYGKSLTVNEMQDIVKRLLALQDFSLTVEGKKIVQIINIEI